MDTKEILWDSNRPKFSDGTIFGSEDGVVAPFCPAVAIEEDLQRAITALRAVPTFNWSVNSLHEGHGQGQAVAAAEYVWKAEDFDWPYKDRPLHDRTFDRQLCVDGEPKNRIEVQSSDFGRSEIRTDTFTVLSKRIHLAPDKSCRISDENRAASFRVCLSGQKKINMAESISSSSSSADSKASQKMSKPPPHRPPLSTSSRSNSDVPRRAAPPLLPKPPPASDPRRLGGEVDGTKTDKRNGVQRQETQGDTSEAVRGIFDFYERSLDILESEELKKRRKKSEVSSPRSSSPEALLEELLDSISADEYDTLPSESKNKDRAKRALSSSAKTKDIRGHISPSSSSSSAERWKPCEAKTFMLTGFQNVVSESSEPANISNISAREQNNNDVACHDQAIEHPTGHSNTKQSQEANISSMAARAQLATTSSSVYQTRHSEQTIDETELTPEDIFEEIMDSMETSGGKRKENVGTERGCLDTTGKNRQAFPNNAKSAHHESVFGYSRDYCADNGLLSVCYNRSRSGMQLCLREKIRKSRSEDFAAAAKDPAHKSAPLSTDLHPDSGKPSTTTPSPVSSSTLSSSSSSFSACPPPETRPTSRRAQEAVYCTVRQKPAPPLRQKATGPLPSLSLSLSSFDARQHTLMYNVRQPPVSKQQPPPPPSEVGRSPRGETADFEAGCDTSADRRLISADQGVRMLEPLPKFPAKDSPAAGEARKASSTGVKEAKCQALLLPDEKRNGSSSKLEEILFSSGFAADNKNYGGEGGGGGGGRGEGGGGEGGGGEEGEEIDLDLDAEFSRNLDACTGSDVECSGIDKLMSAESQTDRSIIIAENKCAKQKMKSPGKLGILIAKRRLRKAPHAVNDCEEAPSTSLDLSQPSSYHQELKTDPTWNPSQPRETSPVSDDKVVASAQGTDDRRGNFYGASGDVSNRESGKDVRGRCEMRVLSEEVTSQEFLLKIVWPKKGIAGLPLGKTPQDRAPKRPPFRELQLHRMLRICDDDDPDPDPDPDPPRISQTNSTRDVPALPGIEEYRHDPPVPEEYATETPEDRSSTCRRIEHVSGAPIAVDQRETVRVIRGPLANGHAVKNIKQVVEGAGYTIIQDFERSPVKRNIKVSCEATECKSESSVGDHQDVTIIRNTILDTLRPNTTPALSRQGSSQVPDEY